MDTFSNFAQSMDWQALGDFLLQILAIIICLTIHETSHGLAALALGDPTAKAQRRLSLNPLHHIDPIGTLMMLVAGFGWAKPVPVDMRYFKHPKSGMALTALAGPVSNFVLAYVAVLLYTLVWGFSTGGGMVAPGEVAAAGMTFLLTLGYLSVGLGIFNLIPFPPLDGSKVVEGVLPDRIYYTILRYERVGVVLLMAALWLGVLDVPLHLARGAVMEVIFWGTEWAVRLF